MIHRFLKALIVAAILQQFCLAIDIQEDAETEKNENEFSFNFLSEKYPDLVSKSQEDFDIEEESESYKHMEADFVSMSKIILGTHILDRKHIEANYGIRDKAYDSYSAAYKHQTTTFLNELPDAGFFKTLKKRKANPKNIFEDILLASEFIYEYINQSSQDNSLVLALGRSPCLPYLAYQGILEETGCKRQRAVHLNFSGNPDMDVARQSSFYVNHLDIARVRNIVTPEKLEHYFNYMDSKELLSSKKIYILDIIGKGAGLNSFLKILRAYFLTKEVPLPPLEFLCLNCTINMESIKINKASSIKYQKQEIGYGTLEFLSNPEENFMSICIPTRVVHVAELTITLMLDNDLVQKLGSFGIEYPAQKWTPKYDVEREKGGTYSADITTYMRRNLPAYIKAHLGMQKG